jgi:hypothetical protein
MVVLTFLPSPCSLRSTQGPAHPTTPGAHASSKGKAGRPDQLWRVSNMSWARAKRDSCAERICVLLSVYLRPCREGRPVPGDPCAGANMAIEEGHGIRYFYGTKDTSGSLGLFVWIYITCILLYLVALNFTSFLRCSGAGGPATSGRQTVAQIHLNLSHSFLFLFQKISKPSGVARHNEVCVHPSQIISFPLFPCLSVADSGSQSP